MITIETVIKHGKKIGIPIRWSSAWGEFTVGKGASNYNTDSPQDAIDTADKMRPTFTPGLQSTLSVVSQGILPDMDEGSRDAWCVMEAVMEQDLGEQDRKELRQHIKQTSLRAVIIRGMDYVCTG